jgi:hypothetical protein
VNKFLLATAAVLAAVFFWVLLTLPPARIALAAADDGTIAGILHVHTSRSDGLSSPEVVAAAAARAGLKFLVFTDHGDATRPPDPPAYRSGVLCLDGVEVSTSGGHYVAIDMPASPYPLGGEARDVVEDVRRLGGFGIAAHPDSPKPQLRWDDWTAPFDAIELLNPDTSWRLLAQSPGWRGDWRLLKGFLHYPFRAPEVIASLIQPTTAVEKWAALARQRRIVTIAGADAHAKLTPRNADPGDSRLALPYPGYEPSFRVMSVHVRVDAPMTGRAATDAAVLMRAIRNGHLYTAVDGLATPPSFALSATNALGTVHEGDVLGLGGPVLLHVQSNAPAGFVTIVHDGAKVISAARDTQDHVVHAGDGPGLYWAEIVSNIGLPPVTWIRSNPVYIRQRDASQAATLPPAVGAPTVPTGPSLPTDPSVPTVPGVPRDPAAVPRNDAVFDGRSLTGWSLEHDARSIAAAEIAPGASGNEIRYRFGLADGPAVGQYASLALNLPVGAGSSDGVRFTVRADKPMRVSLQVRDTTADRWQRSIYVDRTAQERTVTFADLQPVGVTHVRSPERDAIRSLMFVVDTMNTRPGTSGQIWIRAAALVRSAP